MVISTNIIPVRNIEHDKPVNVKAGLPDKWLKDLVKSESLNADLLDVDIIIEKINSLISIKGNIKIHMVIECVKCLSAIQVRLNEKFNVYLYDPKQIKILNEEYELSAEELDYSAIENDELDLADIIREQLFLLLPDYPLCDAACQGITYKNRDIPPLVDKENPFSSLKSLSLKH